MLQLSLGPHVQVSIRTVGEKTSDWMPVGGIAVPRSGSEDAAVSMAIFNNEVRDTGRECSRAVCDALALGRCASFLVRAAVA